MSRFSKHSIKETADLKQYEDSKVENFMGGNSYNPSTLSQLKMVLASSIFGEPSYYKSENENSKSTIELIEKSLNEDFISTVNLIPELRNEYGMRLNPSLIWVIACLHPKRKENQKLLRDVAEKLNCIPSDIKNQFDLYMFLKGRKNNLPNFIKRVWTRYLSGLSTYHINKYKETANLVDLTRIANTRKIRIKNKSMNELMETGKVTIQDSEVTWQTLKSQGKTWEEIIDQIKLPHMALLMNLRNILEGNVKKEKLQILLEGLKSGVKYSKLFPYKYWSAFREIEKISATNKQLVLDTLEECIDLAIVNFPKLKGKTICLSDNSGSAWVYIPSEYGTVTVAEIANLSSYMTAMNSDEGEVGIFGDILEILSVSKRNGLLTQSQKANKYKDTIGASTENGIWLFFQKAIDEKLHYDNIFIYSDMQAGHGGLFGRNRSDYSNYIWKNSRYIDVLKLVLDYRKKVNKNVNVFSVQVAGYNNSVLPENLYRTSILTGWTGKETLYAKTLIDIWDNK